MKKALLTSFAALVAAAALYAASVTSQSALPEGPGAFTVNNLAQVNANIVTANTNVTNLNAQLITALFGTAQSCATTTTCSHTDESAVLKIVIGSAALVSGSPSTAAVTGISPAFTSASTFHCTASDATTIANNVGVLTAGYVSGSAVTFTGPNTVTDSVHYVCVGY
jgi:hypothetical protein